MIIATDGSGLTGKNPQAGGGIAVKLPSGKIVKYHVNIKNRQVEEIIYGDESVDIVYNNTPCKPTNNRGELLAALLVAPIIETYHKKYKNKTHVIISDSAYAIKHMTGEWAGGAPSDAELYKKVNGDLAILVRVIYTTNQYRIRHVPAHVPKSEWANQKIPSDHELNDHADNASDYRRGGNFDSVIPLN